MNKGLVTLEGELFVLVEEDKEGTHISAEICGFDIWNWLEQHREQNVKITLEVKEEI